MTEKSTLYMNIANKSLEIYAGVIILNAIVMEEHVKFDDAD